MRFSLLLLLCLITVVSIVLCASWHFRYLPKYTGPAHSFNDFEQSYNIFDEQGSFVGSIEYSVPGSLIAKEPKWDDALANPPIGARQALFKADSFRKMRILHYNRFQWSLRSVSLKPFDLTDSKWCWNVRFALTPAPNATESYLRNFDVYVLMDGSVIGPHDPDGCLDGTIVKDEDIRNAVMAMEKQVQKGQADVSSDLNDNYENFYDEMSADDKSLARRKVSITDSIIAKQPKWDLTHQNPPLSARRVLLIADRFRMSRFRKNEREWWLQEIALTPLDLKNSKWCWTIRFEERWTKGVITHPGGFEVYVMMNGTVIEPDDPNGLLNAR